MCTSSHGSSVVLVGRLKVNGVALELSGGVTVGNCGFMGASWAASGMMAGCGPSVAWGYFVAAFKEKDMF